jgi:uncharacterized protein (DUF58 family)
VSDRASRPRRFARSLGRQLARLKPNRRLKFTREGRAFIFITLAIGMAAINTGNNLLYLLLGWLLSVIVASGVLSELSLRSLGVARRPPPHVYASRPFLMEIAVGNLKRRLSSFSIEIEDLIDGRPLDKKCYFLKIPPSRTQKTSYRHTFSRRGVYRFGGFRIGSKFPFTLFRKSRDFAAAGEVLVYPAVYPVALPRPRALSLGDAPVARKGRHGEFFGLREYRDGDGRHDIHWRSSARMGRLMVREYEEEAQQRATLVLDNALPRDPDEAERDELERAVSLTASLAAAYLGAGYAVRLIARGALVPFSAGPSQLARILRELALLATVTAEVPYRGALDSGSDSVWVSPRAGAEDAPAGVTHVVSATSVP